MVAVRHPSPTGLHHAAQECRAPASALLGTPHHPDPRRIMNPNGVPSPERRHGHVSPPDGTAWRSGNGMVSMWHAKPKGASPRLGTHGLHDGTTLWSKCRIGACGPHVPGEAASRPHLGCMMEPLRGSMADGGENLQGGTAWRSNHRSSCINVIGVFLTFLDPLDR